MAVGGFPSRLLLRAGVSMKSLALFILLAALALAVTVVKFPEDFSREVVGGVLALYAPRQHAL